MQKCSRLAELDALRRLARAATGNTGLLHTPATAWCTSKRRALHPGGFASSVSSVTSQQLPRSAASRAPLAPPSVAPPPPPPGVPASPVPPGAPASQPSPGLPPRPPALASTGPRPWPAPRPPAAGRPEVPPVFDEFWSDEAIRVGLASGQLVRGRLHVPAFHTDTAYVVTDLDTAGTPAEDGGSAEGQKQLRIPVTGFIGRNRAMHGDTVVAMPLWSPWRPKESSLVASSPSKTVRKLDTLAKATGHLGDNQPSDTGSPVADGLAPEGPLSTGEEDVVDGQIRELGVLVASLIRGAGSSQASSQQEEDVSPVLPLSIVGANAEVQRLRSGLGTLRKALERMGETFDVVQDGPQTIVRLRQSVKTSVGATIAADIANRRKSAPGLIMQKSEMRAAVLARLRNSDERAMPLSMLGADEEVQNLRKGLGSLSKVLRQLDDIVEVVEEGNPPESVARLLPDSAPVMLMPRPASSTLQSAAKGVPGQPTVQEVCDAGSAAPAAPEQHSWEHARCRIVAVLERQAVAEEIVAMFTPPVASTDKEASNSMTDPRKGQGGGSAVPLKVQPRDRRLPAFWVMEEALGQVEPERADSSDEPRGQGSADPRERRRQLARAAAETAHTRSSSPAALLRAAGMQDGSVLCAVRFVDWPQESLSPRAQVVEILGPAGSVAAESDALLAFYGLEWRPFQEQVEQKLRSTFPDGNALVSQQLAAGRADLRHLRCITIDPPNARDLDDAVSVEPCAEGAFRVGVHIADVSQFVRPGSLVDAEARRRATTVYLVGKVYPMLPRWLSENLCSLLPDGDRLSFSVFFTLDLEGNLLHSDPPTMCKAVIRTRARLDYHEVDSALGGKDGSQGQLPEGMLQDLQTLAKISAARRKVRIGKGAVVLERSQLAFRTDADGRVVGLEQEPASSISHHLIEELMVLANHVVALRLAEAGSDAAGDAAEPVRQEAALRNALLRRHPDTEAKVREQVFTILPQGLREAAPSEATITQLLEWCKERLHSETYEAVCANVLQGFKEAEYVVADAVDDSTAQDLAHWALSLESYMHFTSPIRRYADVLVHRRLAHILNQAEIPEGTQDTNAAEHSSFLHSLREAVKTCNHKKRDAHDAQLDSVQLALSDYVRRSGGVDVENAVLTKILLPLPSIETDGSALKPVGAEAPEVGTPQWQSFRQRLQARAVKEALEIYVPLAGCSRCVSLEALNLTVVPGQKLTPADSRQPETGDTRSVMSLRVRVCGSEHEVDLRALERLAVRLVSVHDPEAAESGAMGRHWTIRLPWAVPPAAVSEAPGRAEVPQAERVRTGAPRPPPPLPPHAVVETLPKVARSGHAAVAAV